jgi:hypothetical protein
VIRKQKFKTPWKHLPTGKKNTNRPNSLTVPIRTEVETK